MSERPFQPSRADVDPSELSHYDRVIERQANYGYNRAEGTEAGPHFGALLQAPVVADALSELGVYYRSRGEVAGSFSHGQREWADVVLGHEMSPTILWGHMLDAVASGVRVEAIRAIVEGRDWDLEREELILTTYIRQVINGRVTQQSYDELEKLMGVRGAVEYTAWIGHLQLTARIQAAHHPDYFRTRTTYAMIFERIDSLEAGTADVPAGPRVAPPLAAKP